MKCQNCGNEFEGKFCPECGAPAQRVCPVCGAVATGKFCGECGAPLEGAVPAAPPVPAPAAEVIPAEAGMIWQPTVRIPYLEVDEAHSLWRVRPGKNVSFTAQPGKGVAAARTSLAVLTMGMSILAEKAVEGIGRCIGGTKGVLEFSQLVSFELLEDDSAVASGSVGAALAGGLLAGGAGAIAGSMAGAKTTKKVVEKMVVKIVIDDLKNPCILINLIDKKTKTKSKEYAQAFEDAHKILSVLNIIARRA